jgi:hypothetical protein
MARCERCRKRGDTFPRRSVLGTVLLCRSCKGIEDSLAPKGDEPAERPTPKPVKAMGTMPAPAYRAPAKRRWL